MSKTKLMQGDNILSLKKLPDNSIDSIVTDPPYGLSFMNKKWDHQVPSVDFWKEVYRVLKPGGHVLSFGGTRTYHRMTVNIEDAGFEIRDQIMWLYGSGFPKSMNIEKSINKKEGVAFDSKPAEGVGFMNAEGEGGYNVTMNQMVQTGESTDNAKQWEGWGTALKPANEPICVARKPISEKTITANVLKWGTGGINIDGCRVGSEVLSHNGCGKSNIGAIGGSFDRGTNSDMTFTSEGRFPANIILDEEAGSVLDRQANASRFFYCPKVSKKERNAGCDELDEKETKVTNFHDFERLDGTYKATPVHKNTHPTVKPISLIAYLCRLVTPPNGIVLDPFMGSGSTGCAAIKEGFRFLGMELDEDYFEIAKKRIEHYGKEEGTKV
jgi:site-specific DNA-methyltransferase (adenine-specific)